MNHSLCSISFLSFNIKTGDFSFENMKSAIIIGSAMASFTVEKFGTERLEELTLNQLSERIENFKQLTTFEVSLNGE